MRHADWPSRLARYVDAHRVVPFNWGTHDCATFAAGAVEAMTGERPHMPTWRSVREAMRAERQEGGLAEALTRRFEPIPVTMAQRGDLLLIRSTTKKEPAVAVCLGAQWCAPGTMMLVFGPTAQADAAWRVD